MREKIDRYMLKQEIGRGGMATVYYAHDPRVDRDVAVKILLREMLTASDVRERFQREAKVIATLDHPAIVPVYDFGEDDGDPFIVMRYMSGGSLAGTLKKGGKIPLPDAALIIDRVASALDRAHDQGVIHRDLKPGNILFDQYNNAFLSDFGIVKLVQSVTGITQEGTFFGTPHYMSPEQVIGQVEIDGRSDVYALGVILYEMLTGRAPFHADTPLALAFKHVYEDIPEVLHVTPDLPPEISAILERALAKDRDERYKTAGAFSEELLKIAGLEMAELVRRTGGMTRDSRAKEAEVDARLDALLGSGPDSVGVAAAAPAAPAPLQGGPDYNTKQLNLADNGVPAEPAKSEPPAAGSPPIGAAASEPFAKPATPAASEGRKIPAWAWAVGGITALVLIGLLLYSQGIIGPPAVAENETETPTSEPINETEAAPIETDEPAPTDTAEATQDSTFPIGAGGAQIAFSMGEDPEAYDIFVMNADGSDRERLTFGVGNRGPVWSPDGTRIAFRAKSDTTGNRVIYVMNADGSDITALTDEDTDNYSPTWSPDGEQIAFVSERDGDPEIFVMDADGGNQQALTDNDVRDLEPAWSPDGERILYYATTTDGMQDIFAMNADGSNSRRLTSSPANDYSGAWSPDGEQIIFVSERNGDPELYLMDADGTSQVVLTANSVVDKDPSWSPDGQNVVFSTNRDGNYELYILNIESQEAERLTDTDEQELDPAWQP